MFIWIWMILMRVMILMMRYNFKVLKYINKEEINLECMKMIVLKGSYNTSCAKFWSVFIV